MRALSRGKVHLPDALDLQLVKQHIPERTTIWKNNIGGGWAGRCLLQNYLSCN